MANYEYLFRFVHSTVKLVVFSTSGKADSVRTKCMDPTGLRARSDIPRNRKNSSSSATNHSLHFVWLWNKALPITLFDYAQPFFRLGTNLLLLQRVHSPFTFLPLHWTFLMQLTVSSLVEVVVSLAASGPLSAPATKQEKDAHSWRADFNETAWSLIWSGLHS